MTPHLDTVIATPLPGGFRLGLECCDDSLIGVHLLPPATPLQGARRKVQQGMVAWFSDYLSGQLRCADFPWQLSGTAHQRRVWQAMAAIAPGSTATYGEVAAEIGSGARAVAAACRANPLPLLFPCHRVVARDGLGGFLGATDGAPLVVKRWLLDHERRG